MNEVVSPVRPHVHHVALTVSDLDASVAWYEEVFAVGYLMDAPHEGGTARILADPERTLMFALHRHDANRGESFAETRTGLDHVGFLVPARDDLERWQEHLQRHGVVCAERADKPLTQSPISDQPYGFVLVFRDLDNIQLELFAPPAS
jgi:catechol 2,3-dioxygenase-like lactoylglutathione lyase family enzyme